MILNFIWSTPGGVCSRGEEELFRGEKRAKDLFRAGLWAPGGGAESPEGDSLYAYPARESLWSPVGVAKIMQGAKPVRLAAEAFLLFVQKEPKYAWGCAPRPRRVGTPRPESQSNGFPERD